MTTTYTVYGTDGINAAADECLFADEEYTAAEKNLALVSEEVAANIAEAMKPESFKGYAEKEKARAAKIKQEEERLHAAEKRLGLARSRIVAAMDDYCKKEREYKAFLARPAFG